MKVLVTGATGVVGRATVTELLRRGHAVRLLSRGAEEDAGAWSGPVEAFPADIADEAALIGAAESCAAVIHIAGIIEESGPDRTFERINVDGTRHVVTEAERAGVRRLVLVSSLGADHGESDYHRSKLAAERIVAASRLAWTIVRAGAVIGPGDGTVSVLLRMIRTLPVIPVIDRGDQPFQPVWHEDAARALAACVERDDVAGATLRIAGPEVLTIAGLLDLFESVTDRSPLRLPLPAFAARLGTAIAASAGIPTPFSPATVDMLLEGNVIRDGEDNDLTGRLGVRPTPIRDRIVQLVDDQPEQLPEDGVGPLQRRRFHVDVRHPTLRAAALLDHFRDHFDRVVPFDGVAEPGAPARLDDGATLTLRLPARGHVQIRVERIDDRSITLATLEGHPLAGIVQFTFADLDDDTTRFTIDIVERAASRLDRISMALLGSAAQKRTWRRTAENVADIAGGTATAGVQEASWSLEDDQAEPLEDQVREIVQERERSETGGPARP